MSNKNGQLTPKVKWEIQDKGETYIVRQERTGHVNNNELRIIIPWETVALSALVIVAIILGAIGYISISDEVGERQTGKQTDEPTIVESVYDLDAVFEDSSIRYITESDVIELATSIGCNEYDVIQAAINEIYARNHYLFESAKILAHFESKEWYSGYRNAQDALSHFNMIERENINLLCELRHKYS